MFHNGSLKHCRPIKIHAFSDQRLCNDGAKCRDICTDATDDVVDTLSGVLSAVDRDRTCANAGNCLINLEGG